MLFGVNLAFASFFGLFLAAFPPFLSHPHSHWSLSAGAACLSRAPARSRAQVGGLSAQREKETETVSHFELAPKWNNYDKWLCTNFWRRCSTGERETEASGQTLSQVAACLCCSSSITFILSRNLQRHTIRRTLVCLFCAREPNNSEWRFLDSERQTVSSNCPTLSACQSPIANSQPALSYS